MDSKLKNLKIVFCIPGNNFSASFLKCWNDLLFFCFEKQIKLQLSNRSSSNIYHLRSEVLGADVLKGKKQKPFGGEIDYDYLMWIDSDIIFNPKQIVRLIEHDKDIVSGLYLMSGGQQYACVTQDNWDLQYFNKNGHFHFLTKEDRENLSGLQSAAYVGFGFLLIKKGVFEKIEYPWFLPQTVEVANGIEFTAEDVSFCMKAREEKFEVYFDPEIIVGHEKTRVLL